jgi:hypothetical protein
MAELGWKIRIHYGDYVTYRDHRGILTFDAGMMEDPSEVYLPTARRWADTAPGWARDMRSKVRARLEATELRVVESDEASVGEGLAERTDRGHYFELWPKPELTHR